MDEIEKYIDHLLRPYKNIIDISEKKRELMNGADNQINEYHAQGYSHDEIDDLMKHSLYRLWHQIEKKIEVDKGLFIRKSRLHFILYLLLAFILMIPGIIMGGNLLLPGLMLFLLFICLISYLSASKNQGTLHIHLYLLTKRKRQVVILWLVYLFVNSVVRITEYQDGTLDLTQYIINMYFPLVTFLIPLGLYKIDIVIKKCLKY